MALIVAFGHRKRTGKDTAAGLLQAHLNRLSPLKVQQVSFATKLKEISYELFKWGGLQPGPFYEIEANAHLREVVLPLLGKTPRQIWIEVGNLMRQVHPEVWIKNALWADADTDVIIVRDMRYFNEAGEVESQQGLRYKMIRDSAPVSNDVADCNLDTYDRWTELIYNNGSLADLDVKVLELAHKVIELCQR
jgi:hypothetical protein